MKTFIFYVVFTAFAINSCYGQAQLWEIFSFDNQPYKYVVLERISNDTLFVKTLGNIYSIPIDSIKYMKRERIGRSRAAKGFFLGMIGGGFIGNHLAKKSANNRAMFSDIGNSISEIAGTGLGIIIGGMVGLAVGSGHGADRYYNFKKMKHDKKIETLRKLITKNLKQ